MVLKLQLFLKLLSVNFYSFDRDIHLLIAKFAGVWLVLIAALSSLSCMDAPCNNNNHTALD